MSARILNADALRGHGNIAGRQAVVDILEAGLQAADPYNNARLLVRREGRRLYIGGSDFMPTGDPSAGDAVFDLDTVGRILVVGAGKGVQRVALAIEDALGDRLTGGHVIAKHGDEVILKRIGVTHGGHPVPDEGCVRGCQTILATIQGLASNDLVFTIAANGISSLLTLPVAGVSLEDVRRVTYMMQIERGVPTGDLNPVRNHLDVMKSGRISRYLQPATAVHILAYDPGDWNVLMHQNRWLHTLADGTTFADAVAMLKKWQAWDAAPAAVREHLQRADPAQETVKAAEFLRTSFRIFGVMPNKLAFLPMAMQKAAALGYMPHVLARRLSAEASQMGLIMGTVAQTVEQEGMPFAPPCAIFSTGELLVTVGNETGVGGRDQEFALSAALRIAGSRQIVIGAVDTDGTDGPGGYFAADAASSGIRCLAGGVVDGQTLAEAQAQGVDILSAVRRHDTSAALWALRCGVAATQNISLTDLHVALVMGRDHTPNMRAF